MSSNKGLIIARSILLMAAFTLTTASFVIMIIQFALGVRERSGFVSINDKEDIPF